MMPPLIHTNGNGKGLVDALAISAMPPYSSARDMHTSLNITTSQIEAGAIGNAKTLAELEEIAATGRLAVYNPVLRFCIEHAHKYDGSPPNRDVIRTCRHSAGRGTGMLFAEWDPPDGEFAYWLDELKRATTTRLAQLVLREGMMAVEGGDDPEAAISKVIESLSSVVRTSGGWPWMTGLELAQALVDTQWIVPHVIPLGASIQLDGQIKHGKTTFINGLVRACCVGGTFLGEPVMRTAVVFLSEQGVVSSRYQARSAGLLELPDFHIMHAPRIGDRKWPVIATEAIRKAKAIGAKVIIVDNPTAFAGMKSNEENDSAAMVAMLKPILVATNDDITVILIRHQGYSGHSRGSTALPGGVDIVFSLGLDGERDHPTRVLTQVGRFDTIPARLLVERKPGGEWVSHGDTKNQVPSGAALSLLAAIPLTESRALRRKDLAAAAGIGEEAAKTQLRQFVAAGTIKVQNIGKGKAKGPFVYWRSM